MEIIRQGNITFIIGERNSGKSSKLFKFVTGEKPTRYMGFITLPLKYADGKKGYILRGINIPINSVLAAPDPILLHPPIMKWRRFYFSEYLFRRVTSYIMGNYDPSLTYIIDECGPLEKEGKGWNKLINFLVENKSKMMVVKTMRGKEKNLKSKIKYDILSDVS